MFLELALITLVAKSFRDDDEWNEVPKHNSNFPNNNHCLCVAILQEVIDAAEGENAATEKSEMEELKLLLPDIREKVEDAKESQRTASAASQAIQQTLVGTQGN